MDFLIAITDRIAEFWASAVEIWLQGGWAMIAIATIAFVMFGVGVHVWLNLVQTGYSNVPESEWRRWIEHPLEREGRVGELIESVADAKDLSESELLFEELRSRETLPFERDLKVMKVCVGAAPLVGLLGTVTGMLATFAALSSGGGGDKTMGMVAKGISEALITTETGLVIALPGLFFQYQLQRRFESYKAFLAHLESVCAQALFLRSSRAEALEAERVARAEVAERLRAGLTRSTTSA
ncbi:MAG: MotA/TolQ/ExbB proton channel family protein [Planctomycetota bacterium]|jgi:biopolymer transport protein ExbB